MAEKDPAQSAQEEKQRQAAREQQAQEKQQSAQQSAQREKASGAGQVEPQSRPLNMGGAPGGEEGDGEPPTGDRAPDSVLQMHEDLQQYNAPNIRDPEFNPTTPDGSPPPNNLPGPHGPQGVEHLQADPSET
jgi:hypothetical protein